MNYLYIVFPSFIIIGQIEKPSSVEIFARFKTGDKQANRILQKAFLAAAKRLSRELYYAAFHKKGSLLNITETPPVIAAKAVDSEINEKCKRRQLCSLPGNFLRDVKILLESDKVSKKESPVLKHQAHSLEDKAKWLQAALNLETKKLD